MSDLAGPGPLPERDFARDLRLNEYRSDWRGPVTQRTGVHPERCESPGEVVQGASGETSPDSASVDELLSLAQFMRLRWRTVVDGQQQCTDSPGSRSLAG